VEQAAAVAVRESAVAAAREAVSAARDAAGMAAEQATREAAITARVAARASAAYAVQSPPSPAPMRDQAPPPGAHEKAASPSGPVPATAMGGLSLRERIHAVFRKTGRPLTAEEVFDAVKGDGRLLPPDSPKAVIERILNNPRLFDAAPGGRFSPKAGR
jgi:hypothetical protein